MAAAWAREAAAWAAAEMGEVTMGLAAGGAAGLPSWPSSLAMGAVVVANAERLKELAPVAEAAAAAVRAMLPSQGG